LQLEIVQPFIEFRTGPGKSYPVFYVAQRGELIEIQKRRNDWYKVTLYVNNNHSKTGWIHRDAVGETVVASSQAPGTDGERMSAREHPRLVAAFNPRAYLGFTFGKSSTSDIAGLYTGYAITPKLAIELQANEILGQSFQSTSFSGNASFTPFDRWRIAPFFQFGAGAIDNKARVTTSQQNDASDKFFQATTGFGVLLSKRYRLRFEYRHMNILQTRNENREIETWQLGFIGYL
ncbi:MAG: outer membrane beta-barrel protein, partial [Pseudomonadales bacterium]|nr:outer membrane beta-barrel protein [Pseudomonadales bacterium]